MQTTFFLLVAMFLLAACSSQTATSVVQPTPIPEIAQSTALPPIPSSAQSISTPATTASSRSTYEDRQLCFAIDAPADWTVDGQHGAFAAFTPNTGQASFRVTNADIGPGATLAKELAELQRGSLGAQIAEVKDTTVDKQPALWVTLKPGAEFDFVLIVITPQCGDTKHPLFISASKADAAAFEMFLNRIHFLQ